MMTDINGTDSGKNIVIFSDGTGQEGGVGHNTNVYKLFQMIEDRTEAQIAFYDRGLGTGWRKVTGMVAGAGISKNILECYQFISDHYQWGDRIFLFGFSRGATTVRSLSGFISRFGILPHSRPELAKKAWEIYQNSDEKEIEKKVYDFLERNVTTWCNIEFLGVWDTVAALGLPFKVVDAVLNRIPFFKHSFHDLKLSRCVHHAYHALAIDEERQAFHPTPWHTIENGRPLLGEVLTDPRDGDASEQAGKDRKQTVRQVWFCGVHTDVGGGYKQSSVSDIPLLWMVDMAHKHGLKLYPYNSVTPPLNQNVEDVIHDSLLTGTDKRLFTRKKRCWNPERCGKPVIHASVLERRGKLCPVQTGKPPTADVRYMPWILEKFKEGDYDIEPWDNQLTLYGIPIELGYRTDPDSEV